MILCKSSQYVTNSDCEESTVTASIIIRETALRGDHYEWNAYIIHSYIYIICIQSQLWLMRGRPCSWNTCLVIEFSFERWIVLRLLSETVPLVMERKQLPPAQGCPSAALGPGQRTKPRSKENRGYGLAGFWFHQALDHGILHDLSTRVLDLCPHQRILCVPKVASKITLGETDVDCI